MAERGTPVFQEGRKLTFQASSPTADPVFIGVGAEDGRIEGDKLTWPGCRYELNPEAFVMACREGMWGLSVWSDRLDGKGGLDAIGGAKDPKPKRTTSRKGA